MNVTLAHLLPYATAAFAAAVMVRFGTAKKMLVIRRPTRCASCGVDRNDCRCLR
jgi:hypothetical protein